MREFKVVVLGSGGVGKSALTVQFVSGCFIEKYDPTIEDFYRKEIEVDNSPCVLEILDTAGTEQFASMRDLYIKNGHGFIVMYSLTNHQTFQDISNMKNVISRVKGSQPAPILLVANKLDLECQREVATSEGRELAAAWDCPFIEASAKDRINVNDVFASVVREMNMTSEKRQQKSYCCSYVTVCGGIYQRTLFALKPYNSVVLTKLNVAALIDLSLNEGRIASFSFAAVSKQTFVVEKFDV